MKTKTIKELADELGVSKEAIRKVVANLPETCYQVGANNQRLINAEGIKQIRSKVNPKRPTTKCQPDGKQHQLVATYESQIQSLKEQIIEKDQQIGKLHMLLDQQQQLTLLANQNIERLQIEVKELSEPKQEVKKSFWKIFG